MMLPTEGSFSEVICEMDAVRKIYEDVPDTIPVPPELRHRKVEVIILSLDDDGSKTSVTVETQPDSAELFGALPDFPERGPQGNYEKRRNLS